MLSSDHPRGNQLHHLSLRLSRLEAFLAAAVEDCSPSLVAAAEEAVAPLLPVEAVVAVAVALLPRHQEGAEVEAVPFHLAEAVLPVGPEEEADLRQQLRCPEAEEACPHSEVHPQQPEPEPQKDPSAEEHWQQDQPFYQRLQSLSNT